MRPRARSRAVRRRLAAAAFALLAAGPAQSGAWPREPGGVFVSFGADFAPGPGGGGASAALYGEYGLTRRVTLVGQLSSADEPWTVSRAAASVRYALSGDDAVNRFAASLGVSAPPDVAGMMTGARIETGLHWGRGFESRLGGGWATATARLLIGRDAARPITDLYGLVGLRPAEGWMAMLSASRYADGEGVTYKLAPSAGYELRDEVWIVPRVTQELSGRRTTSFGVSVWLSF